MATSSNHVNSSADRTSTIESHRIGYPRLAAFVSSENDFAIFKSFKTLRSRLALQKQDELIELECRLHEIDQKDDNAFNLQSRRKDKNSERELIMTTIEEKLIQYDDHMERYFRVLEQSKPNGENLQSFRNWLDGNKPLVEEESAFLQNRHDLIGVRKNQELSRFDLIVTRVAYKLTEWGLRNLFVLKEDLKKTDDDNITITSPHRVLAISRALTTIIAVMTLITPMAILYNVQDTTTRLWIVALSTAAFSAVLCILTRSRSSEIFSTTAAFCAVVVVFISSLE